MSIIKDSELGWSCIEDYYVNTAGTVLSAHGYGSDQLTKTNNGGAIGVEIKLRNSYGQIWYGPMIISTVEAYARYSPSDSSPLKRCVINGVTWYVSAPGYWNNGEDPNHLLPYLDLNEAGVPQEYIDDLSSDSSVEYIARLIIQAAELTILHKLPSAAYLNKFVKRALIKNNEHIVSLIPELTYDQAPTENSNNLVKSGGVYTAIHNLVMPPDIYSTTEIKTNKMWIDGKPIYRKCFTGTEMELRQGWVTVTWADVDGLNIDNIVYSYIRGRDSDTVYNNLSYPVGVSTSQNDTYLHIVPIYNIIYFDTVVIEYTKTTD